ncbi:MAG: hypothetical protein Q8M08_12125 [Bacteroidales bacterium]|nr:hypothetical protein [Bacteroidales bacterium]
MVIGITGAFLWLRAFISPSGMPAPEVSVPLYSLLHHWLNEMPLLATILGFCLVLGESFWLNRIFSFHELVLKNSSLSALVFLLLMSFLPSHLTLNPVNISVGFMILIIHHLLISYNKPEHLNQIFAAGFFTAIACMFYLPFIIWFLFVIISFLVFRAGNWRAWMAAFTGLITPYLYFAVWYFWHDEFMSKAMEISVFFGNILSFPNPFHIDFWILGGFTTLMALWGFVLFRSGPQKTVELRAKTNIILWTLVFSLISFVFSKSMAIYHPALAIPALAMVITGTLIGLKKTRVAEIILLVYFLSVLLNNLFIH